VLQSGKIDSRMFQSLGVALNCTTTMITACSRGVFFFRWSNSGSNTKSIFNGSSFARQKSFETSN